MGERDSDGDGSATDDPAAVADTIATEGKRSVGARDLRARTKAKLFGRTPEAIAIGRYELVEELGAGGMGVVYSAYDAELDRKVAIKLLQRQFEGDSDRMRMRREAQAMARLSHPNVAHVYEVGEHEGRLYLAMEFVSGGTLRTWGDKDREWRAVMAMHCGAGRGLAAAHRAGIIHRDYKPDNVLVGADGRARVVDFGLARPAGLLPVQRDADLEAIRDRPIPALQSPLTHTGSVLGTPAYMAAEQLCGRAADARSDQFSFCVALFEGLYGRRPFEGKNLAQLSDAVQAGAVVEMGPGKHGVPQSVHAAILKGLHPEPDQRHASMDALLQELEAKPAKKRSRAWLYLLAVAGIVGIPTAFGVPMFADLTMPPAPPAAERPDPVLAASDLPPLQPEPVPEDPLGVTVHRLDNGLTVYVAPQRDAPRILAAVVIRAGFLDDPVDAPGVAGVVEQMMRAGTKRIGTLDFEAERPHLEKQAQLLEQHAAASDPDTRERLAAEIDGAWVATHPMVIPDEHERVMQELGVDPWQATLDHYTVYGAEVPSPRFEAWAALEGDRFENAVFRNFVGHLSHYVEGWRAEFDSPEVATYAGLELVSYGEVRHDRDAEAHFFAALPYAQSRAFFDAWYRPNNAAIVLVGDIDPRTALPVLEQHFSGWDARPIPERPEPGARPTADEQLSLPVASGSLAFIGWRLPPAASATAAGLFAVQHLLAMRLDDLAFADRLSLSALLEDTSDSVSAFVVPGPSETAETAAQLVESALGEIGSGLIASDDVAFAATRNEVATLAALERPRIALEGIARAYASGVVWADLATDRARGADGEQIAQAARALLDGGTVRVTTEPGVATPPALEIPTTAELRAPESRHSAFAQQVIGLPAAQLQPQFLTEGRDYEMTERGPAVLVTARSPRPWFTLTLRYPSGGAKSRPACMAIQALSYRRDLGGFKRKLNALGVALTIHCDDRVLDISVRGPARVFAATWEAVAPWVASLEVDAHSLETYKREVANQLQVFRGLSHTLALGVQALAFRREQPVWEFYEDVGHVSAGELQQALNRVLASEPDVLFSGPRPEEIAARLEAPRLAPPPTPEPRLYRQLDQPTIFYADDAASGQARVFVAFPCREWNRADEVAGLVLERYLTGPSGLLTEQLEVGTTKVSSHFEFPGRSGDGAGLEISAELNAEETASKLRAVLEGLRRPPDEARFERARSEYERAVRKSRAAPLEIPELLHRALARGHRGDPRLEHWRELGRLDFERFSGFMERIRAAVPIIAVTSNATRFDARELESVASVQRLETSWTRGAERR